MARLSRQVILGFYRGLDGQIRHTTICNPTIKSILKDKGEVHAHTHQLGPLNNVLKIGSINTFGLLTKFIVLSLLVVDIDEMDRDEFHRGIASYRFAYLQVRALFKIRVSARTKLIFYVFSSRKNICVVFTCLVL